MASISDESQAGSWQGSRWVVMATLPDPVPRWAAMSYGGDEEAWNRAKAQCRDALMFWAREGRFGTYDELSRRVTAIGWPDGPHTLEGRQSELLLGQVALAELVPDEDVPLLSALCVMDSGRGAGKGAGKGEGLPTGGFWTFCRDLGVHVGDSKEARERFWVHEFTRCLQRWGTG